MVHCIRATAGHLKSCDSGVGQPKTVLTCEYHTTCVLQLTSNQATTYPFVLSAIYIALQHSINGSMYYGHAKNHLTHMFITYYVHHILCSSDMFITYVQHIQDENSTV